MNKKVSLFLILIVFLISSCTKDDPNEIIPIPENIINSYIFMGHTYASNTTIDERLESFNFTPFQQIWLGGDICAETTKDFSTLIYLDGIFDLGNSNTHWTLGNHDVRNGNIDWVVDVTEKETFHAQFFNNITLLVLNTNLNYGGVDCGKINAQFELIKDVCDTIQKSSHLIVLTHNVVWANIDDEMMVEEYANTVNSSILFRCSPDQNFKESVFPLFENVMKKEIQVIFIAGDFGQNATSYEFITENGMVFLGSGIASDVPYNEQFPTWGLPDKVLVLDHDTLNQGISWQFLDLDLLKIDI
ncbi:MAG: hypothetical protein JEY97_07450 [Bacteroidales bacterium]|nr:hypothetical protein [Bacteroidales bacterium]